MTPIHNRDGVQPGGTEQHQSSDFPLAKFEQDVAARVEVLIANLEELIAL